MKIIFALRAAETQEGVWREPNGVIQVVHNEPRPGVLRKIALGHAGVTMQRGEAQCAISLAALIDLFERVEPALACPSAPALSADQLADELKKFSA